MRLCHYAFNECIGGAPWTMVIPGSTKFSRYNEPPLGRRASYPLSNQIPRTPQSICSKRNCSTVYWSGNWGMCSVNWTRDAKRNVYTPVKDYWPARLWCRDSRIMQLPYLSNIWIGQLHDFIQDKKAWLQSFVNLETYLELCRFFLCPWCERGDTFRLKPYMHTVLF